MLKLFCQTLKGKQFTPELLEGFYQALRIYSDQQVKDAGYKCLDSMDRVPTPFDIIQRMEKGEEETSRFRLEIHKCTDCGVVKLCIEEPTGCQHWQCRTCYTGLTSQQIAERFAQLAVIGKRAPVLIIDETERFNQLADQAQEIIEGDYKHG